MDIGQWFYDKFMISLETFFSSGSSCYGVFVCLCLSRGEGH